MPAKSKAQQRFMGMVHAYQKGKLKDAPESVKKAAGSMTKKAATDFAKTKRKGLPEKVKEALSPDEDFVPMLSEKRSPLARRVRQLLGPGKTAMERGRWWFQHSLSKKEARQRLTQAGIEHGYVDTPQGGEVTVSYMNETQEINVAEDFKSLTFKEYLYLDETTSGRVTLAEQAKLAARVAQADTKQNPQAQQPAQQQPAQQQPAQQQPAQQQPAQQASSEQVKQLQALITNLAQLVIQQLQQAPRTTESSGFSSFLSKDTVGEGVLNFAGGAWNAAKGAMAQRAQAYGQSSAPGRIVGNLAAAGVAAHRAAQAKKADAQTAADPTQPEAKPIRDIQTQAIAAAKNIMAVAKKLPGGQGQQVINNALQAIAQKNKNVAAAVLQLLKNAKGA